MEAITKNDANDPQSGIHKARDPASAQQDPWLFGELGKIRRLLDDMRAAYTHDADEEADALLLEVLGVVRGIEIEYYGSDSR